MSSMVRGRVFHEYARRSGLTWLCGYDTSLAINIEFTMLGYFMRTVCTVSILLFCASSVEAQFLQQCGETPYSIVMHIAGVKNDKGSLTIALYDDDPERS